MMRKTYWQIFTLPPGNAPAVEDYKRTAERIMDEIKKLFKKP